MSTTITIELLCVTESEAIEREHRALMGFLRWRRAEIIRAAIRRGLLLRRSTQGGFVRSVEATPNRYNKNNASAPTCQGGRCSVGSTFEEGSA